MNKETNKTSRLIFAVVFIFCFVRSVIFTTEEFTGYYFEAGKLSLTNTVAAYWILNFFYSLLSALLISLVFKKYGNKAWLPCVLLIANPIFLINQQHLSVFLVNVLYVLYLSCQISEKNLLKIFSRAAFLLISSTVSPKAALGFIPLIIFAECIPGISQKVRSVPTSGIFSVSALISGIVLNRILTSNVSAFNSFTDFLNVARYTESEKILSSLLLSVPSLAVGALFLYIFNKAYNKPKKLSNKDRKNKNLIYSNLNILFVALFVLLIASLFGGYQTLSAISIFVPVYLLQLIFSQNQTAEEALSKIDESITKHTAASALIFVSAHYLCLRFYLEQFGGYITADIFIINR